MWTQKRLLLKGPVVLRFFFFFFFFGCKEWPCPLETRSTPWTCGRCCYWTDLHPDHCCRALPAFIFQTITMIIMDASSPICQLKCLIIGVLWTALPGGAVSKKPDSTVLCPASEYVDPDEQVVREYFECPGPEDPVDFTACCHDACCQYYSIDSVLKLDLKIAMIISLMVIFACIISGITIIICCFMPSCPFYDTCSGGWNHKDRTPVTLPFSWASEYPDDDNNVQTNGRLSIFPDRRKSDIPKNVKHKVASDVCSHKELGSAEHV